MIDSTTLLINVRILLSKALKRTFIFIDWLTDFICDFLYQNIASLCQTLQKERIY